MPRPLQTMTIASTSDVYGHTYTLSAQYDGETLHIITVSCTKSGPHNPVLQIKDGTTLDLLLDETVIFSQVKTYDVSSLNASVFYDNEHDLQLPWQILFG